MSAAARSTPRTRVGAPKVKTGCLTCKIRRVKCDEQRPACNRCTSTGRTCDGYGVLTTTGPRDVTHRTHLRPVSSLSTVVISPYSFTRTVQEKHLFHHFLSCSAPAFAGYFDSSLWEQIVPRVGHDVPAVRHAIFALSALHEAELKSPVTIIADGVSHATRHYGRAITALNQLITTGHGSLDLVLVACGLLVCCDVLQGNNLAALVHLQAGLAILSRERNESLRSSAEHDTVRSIDSEHYRLAASIFLRFDLQASKFAHRCPSRISSPSPASDSFLTLEQSRAALNEISHASYLFLRTGGEEAKYLSLSSIPDQIIRTRASLETRLSQWFKSFSTFLRSSSTTLNAKDLTSAAILRIHYRSLRILLSTQFRSEQTAFNEHATGFQEMVDLASTVVAYQSALPPTITFDMAIIEPLYFTALKCRDPVIRRRAIELLGRAGREGVWHGQMMQAVAAHVVELEERLSKDEGYLEELAYIHGVGIDRDGDGRRATVECSRRKSDGTWEWIKGHVEW
ncbi:MAG: hypothetical protein M1817_006453 [Caeruleum heppii]|nr:MAG: hypothetical protein M1817_006453 [Caeruleum heppii]